MAAASLRDDSVEYLNVTMTSNVVIDDDVIEVSFDDGVTWHVTEHTVAGVRILIGPGTGVQLTPNTYRVLVRVHDIPEVPVIPAGAVRVV